MSENLNDQQGQQQDNQDKVAKKYEEHLNMLVKIVGGKENLKPAKTISGDDTATLVAELFKEESENTIKEAKEGLRALLKKHVELEKALADKRKELEKLEKEKREDFIKAASALFQKIDRVAINNESYAASLKTAVEGVSSK